MRDRFSGLVEARHIHKLKRRVAFFISSMLVCWLGTSNSPVAASPSFDFSYANLVTLTKNKTIIRRLSIFKYPVELSFKLKGEPLKSTETVLSQQGIRINEFDADAGWLKDLVIGVKNISAKSITYAQVNLFFPAVASRGRTDMYQIHLGVDRDRKFLRPELRLAPNESIDVPFKPKLRGSCDFGE